MIRVTVEVGQDEYRKIATLEIWRVQTGYTNEHTYGFTRTELVSENDSAHYNHPTVVYHGEVKHHYYASVWELIRKVLTAA